MTAVKKDLDRHSSRIALIELFPAAGGVGMVHVDSDSSSSRFVALPTEFLQQSLMQEWPLDFDHLRNRLADLLSPLAAAIHPFRSVDTLLICPHGELRSVPLQAVMAAAFKDTSIRMAHLPNAGWLRHIRQKPQPLGRTVHIVTGPSPELSRAGSLADEAARRAGWQMVMEDVESMPGYGPGSVAVLFAHGSKAGTLLLDGSSTGEEAVVEKLSGASLVILAVCSSGSAGSSWTSDHGLAARLLMAGADAVLAAPVPIRLEDGLSMTQAVLERLPASDIGEAWSDYLGHNAHGSAAWFSLWGEWRLKCQ